MNSKKTIWIINQYASTPDSGMGGRHYYLAKELAAQGHCVCLIASSFSHLLRDASQISSAINITSVEGFSFVRVRVFHYGRAQSPIRILNWFLFSWKITRLRKTLREKPDIILYSSPSPIGFLGARYLARKLKAALAFEVRDIWPKALVEIGGFSPKHPFVMLLQYIEDKAYRDSKYVISNLSLAVEHMVERGLDRDKFHWIPNGFSSTEMDYEDDLPKSLVEVLPRDKFLIGYVGTIGVANALDIFIDAADNIKHISGIHFVILGNGGEKERLMETVRDKSLDNVTFLDAIPKKQISSFLSLLDACYIGWLDKPLYRFGIGANKIPEYLYSGKPILHSYSGGGDYIKFYNAGLVSPAGDKEKLVENILALHEMPKNEREKLGKNGKSAAIENFEYKNLSKKLMQIFSTD